MCVSARPPITSSGILIDMPPGDYEILMTIRDELAGQSMEIREPFTVGPPLPVSAAAQPPAEN